MNILTNPTHPMSRKTPTTIVLDCETIDLHNNVICDLAWAVVTRNKIIATHNYIVADLLPEMMTGSFSSLKLAPTFKEVTEGKAEILPYADIMARLKADMDEATYVYAYNANFDRDKVSKTCKALDLHVMEEWFNNPEQWEKWRCLWAWASNTILYKKSFTDFCEEHDLKTPKGFYSTSAETCLKYLRNNPSYVEAHTALSDVFDEFEIYLTIKREAKKEYAEMVDDSAFKKKPFYVIKRLKDAIDS